MAAELWCTHAELYLQVVCLQEGVARLEMCDPSMVKSGPGLWKDFTTFLNTFLYWNLTKFCPNPSFATDFAFFDNDEIKNLTLCLL